MLKVRDVMTGNPICVSPEAPLREALNLMKKGRFRRLPVVEGGRILGIISDRDLRLAMNTPVLVHEKDHDEFVLDTVKVGTCMTTEVYTLEPEDSLEKAACLMRDKKVGGCPVLEGDRLVGILTESDLLEYLIRSLREGRLL